MTIATEKLFTQALGMIPPWEVADVKLDTEKRRIDFEVRCTAKKLPCPACGDANQGIHDRMRRSWRHLDFFQFEAWLHSDVPRVACGKCGKTTQTDVPWARPGSGFTMMFEALALSLCQSTSVRQAAVLLRCDDKQLWRRIAFYVEQARAAEDMSGVTVVGIDETSVKRGHHYITVVHDLERKRLLFATEGRDNLTLKAFVKDFEEHGGQASEIEHACTDMSTAFIKGVGEFLPQAAINFDRFHVVKLAGEAMDQVRKDEKRESPAELKAIAKDDRKKLMWAMRANPKDWTSGQIDAMHHLSHSNLKSARAWRLKTGLQDVYARSRIHNSVELAEADLRRWMSWARRCRLDPFKKLATTIKTHFDGIVRGMFDNRTNAFVEAMNGSLQQAKRAARGYRSVRNYILIAYLRMAKLEHLPASPFVKRGL